MDPFPCRNDRKQNDPKINKNLIHSPRTKDDRSTLGSTSNSKDAKNPAKVEQH